MNRHVQFGILTLAVFSNHAVAQLGLEQVGDNFSQPLFLTSAPGDPNQNIVYVVQKGGLIRTLDTSTGAIGSTPFLNLPAVLGSGQLLTGGEQGLLGMTFARDYNNGNGFVYVNYTAANGATTGGDTRVDRFSVTNGVVNTSSRVNIISFQQPDRTNHKAGWIGFGSDNLLYIASGDGGGGNDPDNFAQNLTSSLGKILRIDPSTIPGVGGYSIPGSNPFASSSNPVTQTIFAYGLRNPFRSSFDSATGDLYIGDVGQNTREEIDFIAAGSPGGQNFGWRALEGSGDNPGVGDPPPDNAVPPIHDYTHSQFGGGSVTGGYVYRGGDILDNGQSLDGTYIFGDFVNGHIFSFRYDGSIITDFRDRTAELNALGIIGTFSISSFGTDNLGRLYVIDIGGQIYRFTGSPVPEPSTIALIAIAFMIFYFVKSRRRAACSVG